MPDIKFIALMNDDTIRAIYMDLAEHKIKFVEELDEFGRFVSENELSKIKTRKERERRETIIGYDDVF